MTASAARIQANRANCLKSTGPRTEAGKMASRRNGLKHGLTGDGVVLAEEDDGEVARRSEALEGELRPGGELGQILVRRLAVLSVRMDRCVEHESAAVAERVRHAGADFDERRAAEVDRLFESIAEEPAAAVRRLIASPEGIDRLTEGWAALRSELDRPGQGLWTAASVDRADRLMGRRLDDRSDSRLRDISRASWGDFSKLEAHEGAGLDDRARREWARDRLVETIDAELADLLNLKESLDLESFEQDRAEAGHRALFDPSKEADRARRYEAAAERGFYRALREFREAEDARAAAEPEAAPAGSLVPGGTCGPLASCCTGPAAPPSAAPRPPSGAVPMPYARVVSTDDAPRSIGSDPVGPRPGPPGTFR